MKLKPITEIKDEELIKQLRNNVDTSSISLDVVPFFISHYNIKRGTFLVGIKLLHSLFTQWTPLSLPYSTFKSRLSDYFPVYKSKYVHISLNALAITKETMTYLTAMTNNKEVSLKVVSDYIDYYNLEKGNYWVKSKDLYACFRLWQKRFRKGYNNTSIFNKTLAMYFDSKKTNKGLVFSLTEVNYVTITQEINRKIKKVKSKKSRFKTPI